MRRNAVLILGGIVVLVIALIYVNLNRSSSPTTASSGQQVAPSNKIGTRTKTSGCVAHNGLPDKACTPGAIIPGATKRQICQPGYSSRVRNVSSSTKRRAYAEYGITSHRLGQYEVDHLISLELGGSNSIANLWPEAAAPKPGFHQKDAVENYLHAQMCKGAISVAAAQSEIANNWLSVYQRMTQH